MLDVVRLPQRNLRALHISSVGLLNNLIRFATTGAFLTSLAEDIEKAKVRSAIIVRAGSSSDCPL
jgi:hypothetical protein